MVLKDLHDDPSPTLTTCLSDLIAPHPSPCTLFQPYLPPCSSYNVLDLGSSCSHCLECSSFEKYIAHFLPSSKLGSSDTCLVRPTLATWLKIDQGICTTRYSEPVPCSTFLFFHNTHFLVTYNAFHLFIIFCFCVCLPHHGKPHKSKCLLRLFTAISQASRKVPGT